jgi:hypothetical protein
MRRRVITTGIAVIFLNIASLSHAVCADDTRPQHRQWIKKLETSGGTFPRALDMFVDQDDPAVLVPGGTVPQHRLWIRKLETPNGTFGSPS